MAVVLAVVLAVVPASVWPQAHAALPGVVSTVVGDFSLWIVRLLVEVVLAVVPASVWP